MFWARCSEVTQMRETPSRLSSPERRGSYLHLVVWGSPRENPGQRPEDAEDPQVVWSDVSGLMQRGYAADAVGWAGENISSAQRFSAG